MTYYAIGDLQGCFDEFQDLLAHIGFSRGRDTLWLVGDIVNRGPRSLDCLRYIKRHEDSIRTVLGNHDLHLLALAYGNGRLKQQDTVGGILAAPDREPLLDWLRRQPLMRRSGGQIIVHAGIWPQWDADTAQARADEVAEALRQRPQQYFDHMYGNLPDTDTAADETGRLRFATNVFTRMRALTADGRMDFGFKSTLSDLPAGLIPWFRVPGRCVLSQQIVFGHWSALGLHRENGTAGIDTGALWGGRLTALNLENGEVFQVASRQRKRF